MPSYRLEDIEVVGMLGGHSGGRSKPLTKSSRKQELRFETVELLHKPSGITGYVEIPAGNYTKKEVQRLRDKTKVTFLGQLASGKVSFDRPGVPREIDLILAELHECTNSNGKRKKS